MIRKLTAATGCIRGRRIRRNLGTFKTKRAAKKHEKAVQYFKRQ